VSRFPESRVVSRVWRAHRERLMFLIVGGWNTVFGYAVFALLYLAYNGTLPLTAIIVIAYVVSVVNNFFTYKYIVFRTQGRKLREALRFLVIYTPSLVANLIVLPLALKYLPLNAYVIQAIYTFVVLVLTYFGHKYFTFRHSAGSGVAESDGRGVTADGQGEGPASPARPAATTRTPGRLEHS
jgi:putative flippase GtrA